MVSRTKKIPEESEYSIDPVHRNIRPMETRGARARPATSGCNTVESIKKQDAQQVSQ